MVPILDISSKVKPVTVLIEIPKMLLQSLFPTLVLGLLPYLVNGAAFNPVEVPVYSTLDEPFVLSVQDDFRVVLKYSEKYGDYEPIISRAKTGLPAFKLTAGNLTTATGLVEEGYTAFTPAGPAVSPSKLSPVWFEKEPSRPLTIPFTAVTHRSGVLRLWSINYGEFYKDPVINPIHVKINWFCFASPRGPQTRGRRASSFADIWFCWYVTYLPMWNDEWS